MPRQFLIVEHNPEGQFLLSKTLKRKFPDAVLLVSHDAEAALEIARTEKLDGIIVHRSADLDGAPLTRMLRDAMPEGLIVMVSGYDRAREAQEAGATRFLSYDEWLRVGTVVADELRAKETPLS